MWGASGPLYSRVYRKALAKTANFDLADLWDRTTYIVVMEHGDPRSGSEGSR